MTILDRHIKELELSIRAYNCLISNGITTLRGAVDLGQDGLLRLPNFGRKSLNELNEMLHAHGIATIGRAPQPVYIGIRINPVLADKLERLARSNHRRADAEAIIILSAFLDDMTPPETLEDRVAALEAKLAEIADGQA